MKITVDIYEHFEGSDDARAIQGGGGAGSKRIERHTNSEWLLKAYLRAMANRYSERFTMHRVAV